MAEARASAPASSANLGPGFDCLALALDLRCTVVAKPAAVWTISHMSEQRPDSDASDVVLSAAQQVVGADRPLALKVTNAIPIARGLGSSAAAWAAGALAAWRAIGEEPPLERLFELVAAAEGHPDNAAAVVFGGLVLTDATGGVHRLPWNPVLRPVVAVPEKPLPTSAAREVLPPAYTTAALVRSVARMGALVAGLLTADAGLLAAAGGDEVHEAPRRSVRPDVADLMKVARAAGALHAAWSGAGPSMLALVDAEHVGPVRSALERRLEGRGVVLAPAVATSGTV